MAGLRDILAGRLRGHRVTRWRVLCCLSHKTTQLQRAEGDTSPRKEEGEVGEAQSQRWPGDELFFLLHVSHSGRARQQQAEHRRLARNVILALASQSSRKQQRAVCHHHHGGLLRRRGCGSFTRCDMCLIPPTCSSRLFPDSATQRVSVCLGRKMLAVD